MIELLRYYPSYFLEAAWIGGLEFKLERINETGKCVRILPRGPMALSLCSKAIDEKDLSTTALSLHSMGKFMRSGPVIIRPKLNLCQALLDTEIRMSVEEFRMPYEIIGVELPREIVAPHWPSLMIVWKPFPDIVYTWTMSPTTCVYYELFGMDMGIEERLLKAEGCDDEAEYNLQVLGGRIALNLCMLASQQPTVTTELPQRTKRHRANQRDDRLRRLAARQCQEIVFRDLVLRSSQPEQYGRGTGQQQGKQRRRGHWKRQPHGEGFKLRKWIWLNEYWTHPELPDGEPQTVILR